MHASEQRIQKKVSVPMHSVRNRSQWLQGSSKQLQLVEVPGHPRMRSVFTERCRGAAAVLFVIDPSDFIRQKADVAGCVPPRHQSVCGIRERLEPLLTSTC